MLHPALTIAELHALIARKALSPAEVVAYYSARLARHNSALNALIELTPPTNIPTSGYLAGIPGVLKDNIARTGFVTSAGSRILQNYVAPYDATVVTRLAHEGGVFLGRSNMDEFAMGSTGEYSCYGPTLNPWSKNHTPGGSSSGSAAAVAAGLVPWALGTETGGSVRQPASFCNLVGLYPTYGLISRAGIVAFCSSSDQVGPLTRTVRDNAILTGILGGKDERDSTSLPVEKTSPSTYTVDLTGKVPAGLRIGVLAEAMTSEGIDPQVRAAFEEVLAFYRKAGATIEYVTLPHMEHGISIYFILSRAEAASNLSRYDGTLYGNRIDGDRSLTEMYTATRHEGFGIEVKRRILTGNFVLSAGQRDAYYHQAQKARMVLRHEFDEVFSRFDVLMSPTASTLPFPQGAAAADPLAIYLSDYFTVPNCITGLPALSIPCGFSREGLPIGFQCIGPRLSEKKLYEIAYAYEYAYPLWQKQPAGFNE